MSDIGGAIAQYLSEEERKQSEKVSAVQKIYRLSAAEKLITALKGSREERSILVRDPNRLVWSAVLSSQRITDAEIESFSAMKNVSDQVLLVIGNHREWTKRPAVRANLVKNPRTPVGTSLRLLPSLTLQDLRSVALDRNVPEAVRKAAQKFLKRPRMSAGGARPDSDLVLRIGRSSQRRTLSPRARARARAALVPPRGSGRVRRGPGGGGMSRHARGSGHSDPTDGSSAARAQPQRREALACERFSSPSRSIALP